MDTTPNPQAEAEKQDFTAIMGLALDTDQLATETEALALEAQRRSMEARRNATSAWDAIHDALKQKIVTSPTLAFSRLGLAINPPPPAPPLTAKQKVKNAVRTAIRKVTGK